MTSLDRVRCDHCGREEDTLRATRWLFLGTRNGQLAGDICERCTAALLPELGERLELLLGRPDVAGPETPWGEGLESMPVAS